MGIDYYLTISLASTILGGLFSPVSLLLVESLFP